MKAVVTFLLLLACSASAQAPTNPTLARVLAAAEEMERSAKAYAAAYDEFFAARRATDDSDFEIRYEILCVSRSDGSIKTACDRDAIGFARITDAYRRVPVPGFNRPVTAE